MDRLRDLGKTITPVRLGAPPQIHVCTYKSGIVFSWHDQNFWLNADDADSLADLLKEVAAHRRKLDAEKER